MLDRDYHRAGGSRVHAALLVLCASLALAGCGSITIPLGGGLGSQSADITGTSSTIGDPRGAQTMALAYETLGDTDWEEVRKTVASSLYAPADAKLEWVNERTGTNGTITGLVSLRAKNGASCRQFTTTMAKIDGVRIYRAEACQGYAGQWEIINTAAAEARG